MPRVKLIAFGPSSIDIETRAHVPTADFAHFLTVQQELLLELQGIIEEGGSGFASPARPSISVATEGLIPRPGSALNRPR